MLSAAAKPRPGETEAGLCRKSAMKIGVGTGFAQRSDMLASKRTALVLSIVVAGGCAAQPPTQSHGDDLFLLAGGLALVVTKLGVSGTIGAAFTLAGGIGTAYMLGREPRSRRAVVVLDTKTDVDKEAVELALQRTPGLDRAFQAGRQLLDIGRLRSALHHLAIAALPPPAMLVALAQRLGLEPATADDVQSAKRVLREGLSEDDIKELKRRIRQRRADRRYPGGDDLPYLDTNLERYDHSKHEDDRRAPDGGGLVLMGGGAEVELAFLWMWFKLNHKKLAAAGTTDFRGGDLVILRAQGGEALGDWLVKARWQDTDFPRLPESAHDTAEAELFDQMRDALYRKRRELLFNSVTTFRIPPRRSSLADVRQSGVLDALAKAEAVFITGGNQAHYLKWPTELHEAIAKVYTERGGVVGGTSAGCLVLGSSIVRLKSSLSSADILREPTHPHIQVHRRIFPFRLMDGILTEVHTERRDRIARLAVLLARTAEGAAKPLRYVAAPRTPALTDYGIALNEATAMVVDRDTGIGTVLTNYNTDRPGAFVVQHARTAALSEARVELTADVIFFRYPGDQWDFHSRCALSSHEAGEVGVDSARLAPDRDTLRDVYTVDPYRELSTYRDGPRCLAAAGSRR